MLKLCLDSGPGCQRLPWVQQTWCRSIVLPQEFPTTCSVLLPLPHSSALPDAYTAGSGDQAAPKVRVNYSAPFQAARDEVCLGNFLSPAVAEKSPSCHSEVEQATGSGRQGCVQA